MPPKGKGRAWKPAWSPHGDPWYAEEASACRLKRPKPKRAWHDASQIEGEVSLQLTRNYNQHWSRKQAVDEFVQNWVDQIEKTGKDNCSPWRSSEEHVWWFHCRHGRRECWIAALLNVSHGDPGGETGTILGTLLFDEEAGILELANYEAILPVRCFLLGYSGADKACAESDTRGKFGDGLPSSTIRLVADGVNICIWTGSQKYSNFGFKMDPHFSHECLHMWVSPSNTVSGTAHLAAHCRSATFYAYQRLSAQKRYLQYNWPVVAGLRDTVVQLAGVTEQDFDVCRYIFLHPVLIQASCVQSFISDEFADVFLHSDFEGKIYVKDMLAQQVFSSQRPRYGYNLKQFSVKSRDRQETLCEYELLTQIAMAWSNVLRPTAPVDPSFLRAKLYDALSNHPDSSEAVSMCEAHRAAMDHVWAHLQEEFQARHGKAGFPVVHEDTEACKIITDKLKKTPVLISSRLFGCLAAADAKWACSAEQAWHAKRLKAVRHCAPECLDVEPYPTIVRVLEESVGKVHPLPKLRLVSTRVLDEVSVLDYAGVAAFELMGFEAAQREDLSGIYEECRNCLGHGKPIFKKRGESSRDLYIFWTNGWLLCDGPLEYLHRCTNPNRCASCPHQNWWAESCCDWLVWDGFVWHACTITIKPVGSGRNGRMKQSKLILNALAIKDLLQPSSSENRKYSVIRSFNTLFDAVLHDFKHVAKLQLSPAIEREAQESLMRQLLDLDLHTFQKHVDKLLGFDRASTIRRRLTAWLEGESDDEDRDDPVEQQARKLIREQIELGVLRVNPKYNDSLAWVGDAVLDASLGLLGVESDLRPRELDQLRQKLFCTKRMGCDVSALGWKRIREAAERREQRVGELTMEQKAELTRIYELILSNATVPRAEDPARERSFLSEISMSVKEARTSTSNIALRTREWQDYGDGASYAGKRDCAASSDVTYIPKLAVCHGFLHGTCRHGPVRTCGKAHPCKFFQQGACKHGSHCRFDHVSCPQIAW